MRQGPPTPVSYRSESPRTPYGRPSPGATNDYFAVANNAPPPSPRHIKRPGGYGGFAEDEGYTKEPIPSPARSGAGVLQRMDSIAPGPFEATGQRSPLDNAFQPRKGSIDPSGHLDVDRPGTSYSNLSAGSGDNVTAPKAPRKNGYGGFGPPARFEEEPQPESLAQLNRAETFPRQSNPSEAPFRTPSAPGARPDRTRQSQHVKSARVPSMGPDTSRRPPPRKSLIRPAQQGSVDIAAEFGIGNPYHTPSDSASSGHSAFSGPSYTSSQTSPARSQSRRQGSDPTDVDSMMDEVNYSMQTLQTRDPRSNPRTTNRSPSPLMEPPMRMSPSDEQYDSTPTGSQDRYAAPTTYATSPQYDEGYFTHEPRFKREEPAQENNPIPQRNFPTRQSSKDPGSLPYRGDCKACGLPIRGKSVSSADGRLTGRYHKACFVCTTCSEPFTSAEFYVLDNKPFCELHYHELNGSLCGSCGRGIEGQYVEDEAQVKYHVGCFCCLDCGRSLSDGYFEVDGRSYCEEDAWNRVQSAQPYGGSYPPRQDQYTQQQAAPRRPPPHSAAQAPPRRGPGPPRPGPGMPGLPSRPSPGLRGAGPGAPRPPRGAAMGMRPGPGMRPGMAGLAPPPPMMNKRSTRLGMM